MATFSAARAVLAALLLCSVASAVVALAQGETPPPPQPSGSATTTTEFAHGTECTCSLHVNSVTGSRINVNCTRLSADWVDPDPGYQCRCFGFEAKCPLGGDVGENALEFHQPNNFNFDACADAITPHEWQENPPCLLNGLPAPCRAEAEGLLTNTFATTSDVSRRGQRTVKCAHKETRHPCLNTAACPGDPVDCQVSDFTQFSNCSKSCGGGVMTRTRVILAQPQNGGATCPAEDELTQTVECNTFHCPLDCKVGPWSPWTQCSARCGGGSRKRSREVLAQPLHGGEVCPHLEEEEECNITPCAEVDCKLSAWGEFSACSVSCGPGSRTRTREVLVQADASSGGRCDFELSETELCNNGPCAVNCSVSDWSSWTPCLVSCGGGIQTRTRAILSEPQHGGQPCPEQMEETRMCGTNPCPIDCKVGMFGNWSACSASCGGGVQLRTRPVLAEPEFGGALCPELQQSQTCNEHPCPDCEYSPWGAWSACSATCGNGGTQLRTRTVVNRGNPDADCGMTVETRNCEQLGGTPLPPCPQDCQVSAFGDWSECSAQCGGGQQERNRRITVPQRGDGQECPPLSEFRVCNEIACPVDCKVDAWGPWGECSQPCGGGHRQRRRDVLQPAANGGAECPALVEQDVCNTKPCDCRLSEWGEWSECSAQCGTAGVVTRERHIVRPPGVDGAPCGDLTEELPCNRHPCPVNCTVGDWSPWTPCDKTCGGGSQRRERPVTTEPLHGGAVCPATSETRSCNPDPCAVDCQVSQWSEFGECSMPCGEGVMTRTRTIERQPAHGGLTCPALSDSQACFVRECTNDCTYTEWTEWTACSASCGGEGVSERTRFITKPPEVNPGDVSACVTQEQRVCGTQPCPVDCKLDDFSEWSECSVPCGGGTQRREREIESEARHGGQPCPPADQLLQVQPCNTAPCPIDCKYSNWTAWSACSSECGGGVQRRERSVVTDQAHGGKECPPGGLEQYQECNTNDCVPGEQCQTSPWSAWGPCSRDCGGGVQERVRLIEAGSAGDEACADVTLREERECNVDVCKVDCSVGLWTNWTACSKSCGEGGVMTRTRPVLAEPAHGGAECPHLNESVPCGGDPCPQNCEVGEWGEWSDCTGKCGEGTQTRDRPVVKPSQSGGRACPPLRETRNCVHQKTEACPPECKYSAWSEWGACSATCGAGYQERTRSLLKDSARGTNECGLLLETRVCSAQPCPVSCEVGDWNAWGKCTAECGGGLQVRTRDVVRPPANGGEACPPLQQAAPCNTAPCPVDCQAGEWSAWSSCNKQCGGGLQKRQRGVVRQSAYGGQQCPNLVEERVCNTAPCIDGCEFTPWGAYGDCSAECGGGVRVRSRGITSTPDWNRTSVVKRSGAHDCGELAQLTSCNSQPCPEDCEVGPWGAWSPCSGTCGRGIKTRRRSVLRADRNGGRECPRLIEVRECSLLPCPEDCEVGPWGAWGKCSANCGHGRMRRERNVTRHSTYGGKACPALVMDRECFERPCPDGCEVGSWGEWGACSAACGGGARSRRRKILSVPTEFQLVIDTDYDDRCGLSQDVAVCNTQPCPVDCVADASWGDFGPCTETCGGGSALSVRGVVRPNGNGGKSCEDVTVRSEACNVHPCPPGEPVPVPPLSEQGPLPEESVDCLVGVWTAWGECGRDSECDPNPRRLRTRKVFREAAGGGLQCPHLEERMPCELPLPEFCAASDCKVGNWSAWSACVLPTRCSRTGLRTRVRNVTEDARHGGAECPALLEHADCSGHVPDDCLTCELSPWSVYGECTVPNETHDECETRGRYNRTRHITSPVDARQQRAVCYERSKGGAGPELVQWADCLVQRPSKCDEMLDCELTDWEEWGECHDAVPLDDLPHRGWDHKTVDQRPLCPRDGIRVRRRYVRHHETNGGIPCPDHVDMQQTESCSLSCESVYCPHGDDEVRCRPWFKENMPWILPYLPPLEMPDAPEKGEVLPPRPACHVEQCPCHREECHSCGHCPVPKKKKKEVKKGAVRRERTHSPMVVKEKRKAARQLL